MMDWSILLRLLGLVAFIVTLVWFYTHLDNKISTEPSLTWKIRRWWAKRRWWFITREKHFFIYLNLSPHNHRFDAYIWELGKSPCILSK